MDAAVSGTDKQVGDVFGSWGDWNQKWSGVEEDISVDSEDEPDLGDVVSEDACQHGARHTTIEEWIDLHALKQWEARGQDRRQEQSMEFIAHVESHGRPIQGTSLFSLKHTYRKKIPSCGVVYPCNSYGASEGIG